MKLLLEKGAQPDFGDGTSHVPLSRALEKGKVAIMQLLLAKEAKMDFKYNVVSERHPYLNKIDG